MNHSLYAIASTISHSSSGKCQTRRLRATRISTKIHGFRESHDIISSARPVASIAAGGNTSFVLWDISIERKFTNRPIDRGNLVTLVLISANR